MKRKHNFEVFRVYFGTKAKKKEKKFSEKEIKVEIKSRKRVKTAFHCNKIKNIEVMFPMVTIYFVEINLSCRLLNSMNTFDFPQ